tara:strand:+ start:509 stop:880 length:372 start_codon:yes stop_codon:yes gene_type:complete
MNFAIIFNDGNLLPNDFKSECQKEKWLPITVLREKATCETHVPIFNNSNTAHNFMKRNFDVDQVTCGIIILLNEDLEAMEKRGWKIMKMKFPRRIKTGHPEYDLDVEVFETKEEPELSSYSRV